MILTITFGIVCLTLLISLMLSIEGEKKARNIKIQRSNLQLTYLREIRDLLDSK